MFQKLKLIIIPFVFIFFNINLYSNYSTKDIYIKVNRSTNKNDFNKILKSKFGIELKESVLPYHLSKTSIVMLMSNTNKINSFEEILKLEEPLLRTFRINIGDDKKIIKILKELRTYEEVEYCEKVPIPKLLGKEDYNDPNINNQYVLDDIQAFDAYEISEGDSNIVIGISDSGADQNHEDINPNLFRFWGEIPNNMIDDDGNGFIDDFQGVNLQNQEGSNSLGGNTASSVQHGLQVSGIAGAKANNGIGVMGVGNKCRIFPIKISIGNSDDLVYSYESIIYATLNNFDVLNCSWGIEDIYSPIHQEVIDYAVGSGVLIVAAAGNLDNNNLDSRVKDWYPASYNGIIAVGSLTGDSKTANSVILHPQVDIMVRGEGNYTTQSNNRYSSSGINGSSFASPVIAGAAGIIKSHFPNLSPYQIEHLIKRSGKNIGDFNSTYKEIIPKSFNLLSCLNTDMNNFFGLIKISHTFKLENNDSVKAFRKGDVVNLSVNLKNYFTSQTNVSFKLSIGKEFNPDYIEIINDSTFVESISVDEEIIINNFKLRINENSFTRVILRLDYENNGKRDFILIPFDNQPSMTHFENGNLIISLANDGKIGFIDSDESEGYGYIDKKLGNPILYSGFIGFYNDITFSATSGNGFNESDLELVSDYIENENLAEFKVRNSDVSFNNKVLTSSNSENWVKFNLRAKSVSAKDKFAIGIVGDYDLEGLSVNSYLNNKTEYFPEADFSDGEIKCATQIAYYEEDDIYFGISAFSNESDAIPQAAGLSTDESYFITPSNILSSLSSGTTTQLPATTDIGFVVGLNFQDGLNIDEKECSFCYSMAKSKEELKNNLEDCVLGSESSIIKNIDKNFLTYTNNTLYLRNIEEGRYDLIISNLEGKIIKKSYSLYIKNTSEININLKSGIYFLSLHNNNANYNFNFMVDK